MERMILHNSEVIPPSLPSPPLLPPVSWQLPPGPGPPHGRGGCVSSASAADFSCGEIETQASCRSTRRRELC